MSFGRHAGRTDNQSGARPATYLHFVDDLPSVLDAQNGYVLGLFGQQQLVEHFQRAVFVPDGLQCHCHGARAVGVPLWTSVRRRATTARLLADGGGGLPCPAKPGRCRSHDVTQNAQHVHAHPNSCCTPSSAPPLPLPIATGVLRQ